MSRAKPRKTNLIDTLTHRALNICSKSTLKHDPNNIPSILQGNGCPEFLIDSRIFEKLLRFKRNAKESPKQLSDKYYLGLAKILKFDRKIKTFVANCFVAVQPRVVFSTRQILYAIHEDLFPLFNKVMSYMNKCATAIAARGSNVSMFAGQNPPACAEIYSEQNQSRTKTTRTPRKTT